MDRNSYKEVCYRIYSVDGTLDKSEGKQLKSGSAFCDIFMYRKLIQVHGAEISSEMC